MKKLFSILFILTITNINLQSQEQWNWQPIDTAYLICQYEFLSPSIIVPHQQDDMRLEIGKKLSKFYSRITFEVDSLWTTAEGRQVYRRRADEIFRRHSKTQSEEEGLRVLSELPSRKSDCIVYKNYPIGEMYVQDASGNDYFDYTDEFLPQNWQIHPDTMTHLGYHCQKATCTWRGRDYEAWFTSEIPVNDGPMKFFGLPGLIVKVADIDNAYIFELKGIEAKQKPIYLNTLLNKTDHNYKRTNRCELMQRKSRSFKNMIRALKRDMARLGKSADDLNEDMYDVMERDCK